MIKTLAASAAMTIALTLGAQAATLSWSAAMTQDQEVPTPVLVPGVSGIALGTIDTVSGLLDWDISWSGLSGAPVGLHFHANALPGATAPVVIDVGDLSGLDTPSIGSTTIPFAQIASFLDGLYYVNLHTALNPTGEIRGQVTVSPVPLPAAAPLSLAALSLLGGLGVARRRRNQSA